LVTVESDDRGDAPSSPLPCNELRSSLDDTVPVTTMCPFASLWALMPSVLVTPWAPSRHFETSLVDVISLTGTTSTCVGQGGYDGLSAVLVETDDSMGLTWVGLIFAGDFPPLPEAPAVE